MAAAPLPKTDEILQSGELCLDLSQHKCFRLGRDLNLSPMQIKFLAYFMRNEGKVLTFGDILRNVWGLAYAGQHYHQYIRAILPKLNRAIGAGLITSVISVGYRFETAASNVCPGCGRAK